MVLKRAFFSNTQKDTVNFKLKFISDIWEGLYTSVVHVSQDADIFEFVESCLKDFLEVAVH